MNDNISKFGSAKDSEVGSYKSNLSPYTAYIDWSYNLYSSDVNSTSDQGRAKSQGELALEKAESWVRELKIKADQVGDAVQYASVMQNIKAIENSLADYKDNPSDPTNSAILNVYASDRGPTFNTYHATLDQIAKYQTSVQKEVAAQKAAEQTFNAIPTITGNNKGFVQTPQHQLKYNDIFDALLKTYEAVNRVVCIAIEINTLTTTHLLTILNLFKLLINIKRCSKKLEAGRGEFSDSLYGQVKLDPNDIEVFRPLIVFNDHYSHMQTANYNKLREKMNLPLLKDYSKIFTEEDITKTNLTRSIRINKRWFN